MEQVARVATHLLIDAHSCPVDLVHFQSSFIVSIPEFLQYLTVLALSIADYIADAARAKLAEDKALAENAVLRREAAALM